MATPIDNIKNWSNVQFMVDKEDKEGDETEEGEEVEVELELLELEKERKEHRDGLEEVVVVEK